METDRSDSTDSGFSSDNGADIPTPPEDVLVTISNKMTIPDAPQLDLVAQDNSAVGNDQGDQAPLPTAPVTRDIVTGPKQTCSLCETTSYDFVCEQCGSLALCRSCAGNLHKANPLLHGHVLKKTEWYGFSSSTALDLFGYSISKKEVPAPPLDQSDVIQPKVNKMEFTNHHDITRNNIQDIVGEPTQKPFDIISESYPIVTIERCDRHPRRFLTLYCCSCSLVLCEECFLQEHTGAYCITLTLDAMAKRDSSDIATAINNLKLVLMQLYRCSRDTNDALEMQLVTRRDGCTASVRHHIESVRTAINIHEQYLWDQITNNECHLSSNLRKHEENISLCSQAIQEHLAVMVETHPGATLSLPRTFWRGVKDVDSGSAHVITEALQSVDSASHQDVFVSEVDISGVLTHMEELKKLGLPIEEFPTTTYPSDVSHVRPTVLADVTQVASDVVDSSDSEVSAILPSKKTVPLDPHGPDHRDCEPNVGETESSADYE